VLSPADLTTSTHQTVPTVGVPRRGLSERELDALSRRVDLVTWPEREPVASTVRYLDEALEPGQYSRLVLEPTRPLTARWYAIRARYEATDAPDETVAPRDGEHSVSRFFVGDGSPVVRRVHARARDDGGGDVEVVFSERVALDADPFAVLVDGARAECRLGNDGELFGEEGAMLAWLDCPFLPVGAAVTVGLAAPIYALGGAEVRDPAGAALASTPVALDRVPRGAPEPRHDLVGIDHPAPASRDDPETARTYVPGFGLARGI
jgi:hypothetical protein